MRLALVRRELYGKEEDSETKTGDDGDSSSSSSNERDGSSATSTSAGGIEIDPAYASVAPLVLARVRAFEAAAKEASKRGGGGGGGGGGNTVGGGNVGGKGDKRAPSYGFFSFGDDGGEVGDLLNLAGMEEVGPHDIT